MSTRQAVSDHAYVLHSRAYRNTSVIIEVLSQQQGRIGLLAKGARTPKSPFYGVLQPFNPLYIHYAGSGELALLYKAETMPAGPGLHGEQLFHGIYFNELLMRLLHRHDPHAGLFILYRDSLQQLATHPQPEVVLRYFEVQLLEQLGYGLNLTTDCVTSIPVQSDQQYHYQLEQGPRRAGVSPSTALVVAGHTLLALATRALITAEQRSQAKALMRTVLEYYLGQQPVKARELYRHFRHG
ncbi:MAG: DNA repair protein RecO [Gammaproteobacteria bacterium]|nr:DNA repair protein RecO [Gammaproteobacteria bacterium]